MERREAPAEDRADVGIGHGAQHAFLVAARGLVGLSEHQAVDQLTLLRLGGRHRAQRGQLRPQLLAVVAPVVEALAGLLADAADLAQRAQHAHARVFDMRLALGGEVLPRLLGHVHAQAQAHLVLQRQRRHRHAGLQPRHLDAARVHALLQHRDAFHHVGREHARGVEAAAVVDDDRRLADLLHEVEAARQGLARGVLADDDLHQRHLLHRREEVQADEVLRPRTGTRESGDRQRGRVRGEHRVTGQLRLGLRRDLGLQRAVLEHRLDHQVAALEVFIARGRGDARLQLV